MTRQDAHAFFARNFLMVEQDTDIAFIREQLEEREDEFCYCERFTQKIISRYCYNGFLPMSVCIYDNNLLALKLHKARVLMPPARIKIKKGIVKKFADYHISVDKAFHECISGIETQHQNSWLTKPLIGLFAKSNAQTKKNKVKLHSVELWKGDVLTAGEIGYTVGSSYTSLTGFHTVSSSGTVQIYALGKLLQQEGYTLWDMGMYAPYKIDVGGRLFSREAFLRILATARDDSIWLASEKVPIVELLEETL